jgi:pimeloyl-ACP methyl ester carboxylesterase
VAKTAKPAAAAAVAVRMRRAYFDCSFGQLHVRTAFPGTGGFDELVTLFCLHDAAGSSRSFATLLPEIADVRSVYAPDLPGCGESDAAPEGVPQDGARAVFDLASDLRLRQIDLLGTGRGALAALELAAAKPELVRRLVLLKLPAAGQLPAAKQPLLILRTHGESAEALQRAKAALPQAKFAEFPGPTADPLESAPRELAEHIGAFLSAR